MIICGAGVWRRMASTLARTPLYDLNIRLGGKMVDFAGFDMPVLFKGQSHIESHNWVRNNAGLFDVSHMLQHKFRGPDAVRLLERVTPSDLHALRPFTSTLSVLLNEHGGIVDDTIISRHGHDEFYVVTNAGCREKDLAFFSNQASLHGFRDLEHTQIGGGLLALQGPKAAAALQKLTDFDLSQIGFGESAFVPFSGPGFGNKEFHVARGGYTGEDGFEISIPDEAASSEFAELLLGDQSVVKPIGLAARDSLRLEAGMCLYGSDLTESTTPVAARLAWVIGKRRRETRDFNGAEAILTELAAKSGPQRTGLVSKGPAPRHGTKVYDAEGKQQLGEITSGSMSPTLGQNVAMAYLPRTHTKTGTPVQVEIRGKLRPAEVAKMPFVAPNYYRKT